MKYVFGIALACCMTLALTSCCRQNCGGDQAKDGASTQSQTAPSTESAALSEQASDSGAADAPKGKSKTLVAIFSATGHTEPIAQYVADALGADLYRLAPAQPYSEEDLNYNDPTTRATVEQNDPKARPRLADYSLDLTPYDTILIGHPIWWGEAPKLIYTFLENYDFSGKTIATFCTSASSGLGSSAEHLKTLVPQDVKWLESKRFEIGAKQEDAEAWLKEIGLK